MFMVSTSLMVSFMVSLCLTFLAPIVLMIVLGVRKKITPAPLAMGLLTFFVSQVILRMPLLNILSATPQWQSFSQNFLLFALVTSFSAGLFEESARLGGCAILKRFRSYRDAVSFGLGHGFCEVLFLVGFSQINNLMYAVSINNGSLSTMLSSLPAETVEQMIQQFTATSPVLVYVAILERLFAVTFHIFAALLIVEGLRNRHALRGYLLALLAHTAFNFVVVLLDQYVNLWVAEGAMLVMAAGAAVYIFHAKKYFRW
ncbi:MAG: YhfC family intramembrane metalloprotease [Clostridium sp.]